MRAMNTTERWGRAVTAAGALGYRCGRCAGAREASGVSAQAPTASANQPGLPVVVSCEPTQRTVVRPTMVNGVAMSQVECVPGEAPQPVAYAQPFAAAPIVQPVATPIAYRPAASQRLS